MTWRVICTESRQELRATAELADRGFSVYFPTERIFSVVHHRKTSIIKPLFPGYIFAEPCPQWPRLFSVPGILSGSRATLPGDVTEAEMARIREAEAHFDKIVRETGHNFRVGETLQVVAGPFAAFNAYIQAVDSNARITILVNLFGRPTKTRVDASQLARI